MKYDKKTEKLASELSEILKDYENWSVTPENVMKWIYQFRKFDTTREDEIVILKNLIKTFKITYFSKNLIIDFLKDLNERYKEEFSNVSFLDIQHLRKEKGKYKPSESQNNLIDLLKSVNHNVIVNDFSKNKFVYLDDYFLSGGSLKRDIEVLKELEIDLKRVELKYLCILVNTWSENFDRIKKLLSKFANIECEVCLYSYWKYYDSDEFDKLKEFDDRENSNLVKNFFLKANEYIIEKINYNKEYWNRKKKSMFISATYKNIPNNAPICLWWGDKDSYWFPLLKRNEKKQDLMKDIDELEWLQNL